AGDDGAGPDVGAGDASLRPAAGAGDAAVAGAADRLPGEPQRPRHGSRPVAAAWWGDRPHAGDGGPHAPGPAGIAAARCAAGPDGPGSPVSGAEAAGGQLVERPDEPEGRRDGERLERAGEALSEFV